MELAAQRHATARHYVLDMVKGIVIFVNNYPWHRNDWDNHMQIELTCLCCTGAVGGVREGRMEGGRSKYFSRV